MNESSIPQHIFKELLTLQCPRFSIYLSLDCSCFFQLGLDLLIFWLNINFSKKNALEQEMQKILYNIFSSNLEINGSKKTVQNPLPNHPTDNPTMPRSQIEKKDNFSNIYLLRCSQKRVKWRLKVSIMKNKHLTFSFYCDIRAFSQLVV